MANAGTIAINLIARVENLEKQLNRAMAKIDQLSNRAKSGEASMNKFFATINRGFGFAAPLVAVRGIVDGITEFDKALKNGDDAFLAFVSQLPLIGSVTKSFSEMAMQVSGLNDELKAASSFMEALGKLQDFRENQNLSKKLMGAGGESQEKMILALNKYENEIKKIDELEKSMKKQRELNPDLALPNLNRERILQEEIYQDEITKIQKDYARKRMKEKEKEIQSYQDSLGKFSNQINTELDKLDFIAKGDTEYIAGLKASGISQGFSMKDMEFALNQAKELEKRKKEISAIDIAAQKEKDLQNSRAEAYSVRASGLEVGSAMSISGMTIGAKESLEAKQISLLSQLNEKLAKIAQNTSGGSLN